MKDLMTITYWRLGHPLPVESPSDFYYVNLARRLYTTIRSTEMGLQSTEAWVAETAMTLAYYMEDVVSGLGFWHTLVSKHKALYGKYLPFYAVDEEDYYADEINPQDVNFLLWMAVQDNKRETLINPENPYLLELAQTLFRQLDREFEKAPINELLVEKLRDADTYRDLNALSVAAIRMMGGTYLFRSFTAQTETLVAREVDSLLVSKAQAPLREYTVRFMQVFVRNTGALALKGTEWMSALLNFWGLESISKQVAEMEIISPAYYQMKNYDTERLVLEAFDGTEYSLRRDIFEPLVDQLLDANKVCLCMLVRYNGEWNTAGAVSWYPATELFEQYKNLRQERKRINEEACQKVVDATGGYPMVYFEDWNAFMEWGRKHNVIEEGFKPTLEMQKGRCLALFASPREGMTLVPNEARFICDPDHNPCYNAAQARRGSLNLLISAGNLSTDMLHFILDHQLIPDATLAALKDGEHGKQLVQENLDFIARFMRTIDY